MKKLLIGLLSAGAVAAVAMVATNAFFSDTETSTGNTFTAGKLDLKMSNNWTASGAIGSAEKWTSDDVKGRAFFKFTDVKPGDWGENTIDYTVVDNDAFMCAKLTTTDSDVTSTINNTVQGQLGQYLSFVWWVDNGDNILQQGEKVLYYGMPHLLKDMVGSTNGTGILNLTFADKIWNINKTPESIGGPLTGNTPYYLGVGWCLGTITLDYSAPAGFSCSGIGDQNTAQGDTITGTLDFNVVQSRNNAEFLCPEHVTHPG